MRHANPCHIEYTPAPRHQERRADPYNPPAWMKHHPEEGHRDGITHHMRHARSARVALDRMKDTDHDRRRATVQAMKEHVTTARQHSRAIIAAHHDAYDRLPGNPERSEPTICPKCYGLNGKHHTLHQRYGNGAGGNHPCPLDPRYTAEEPQP